MWVLGAVALEEFSLALLIGLVAGIYSSIFVATPLLGTLKRSDPNWKASRDATRVTGEPLRDDGRHRQHRWRAPGTGTCHGGPGR